MLEPIIRLRSVTKTYSKNKILDSISFDILPNTINIVIGPNSAGKSTLAKIIAGMDENFSGDLLKNNKLTTNYLPQNIKINQYLPITTQIIFDNLVGKKCIKKTEIFERIMNFCKMSEYKEKQVHELSGGTLQKLFISGTLAKKSDVIILDEPTQNLDVQSEEEFYQIIMLMKQRFGTTFILTSHDIHVVLKFADKIICLNNHICCTGSPKDIDVNDPFLSLYKHHHNHSH